MKIYATSDIHGYNIKNIKSIKEETSSILIDNGDFFIGSPEATYWNHHGDENELVKFANEMNYDVMIPGNHDFDYGLEFYLNIVKSLKCPVVSCNIFNTENELIFDPYTIIEREGKSYAIIGAMTSCLFQLSMYENVKDIVVKNAVEEISMYVSELKDKVDRVIVSYHGGVECDLKTGKQTQYPTKEDEAYAIASSIDGIDLLICGHQHRENKGVVNKTLLVQIPDRLKKISVLDVESWEHSWMIPSLDIQVDLSKWLSETVNLDYLETFVSEYLPSDMIHLEVEGKTVQDLLKAFTNVYPIRQYHFSQKETEHYSWFKSELIKDSYTITTNLQLDFSRQKNYTVHNIFDAYYHFLISNHHF